MIPINCIITEDEPLAADKLESFIRKIPFLNLLGIFDNGIDALAFLKETKVDLLFLDIQMDKLTGIQLLESLSHKPIVILTTAYGQYALKGYELSVCDYLLKPFSFNRFVQAVNKAYDVFSLQQTQPTVNKKHIFIKTENRIEKVQIDDILYIEGMRDYLRIITTDKKIMTLQNFQNLSEILPSDNFIRVHKSFMIAIDKIDSIERNRIKIGENLIPVSQTYRESFFEALKKSGFLG